MIASSTWIPFAAGYLLQSIGGSCNISSTYVLMTSAVPVEQRAKYFSYISIANALGAILGPIAASNIYCYCSCKQCLCATQAKKLVGVYAPIPKIIALKAMAAHSFLNALFILTEAGTTLFGTCLISFFIGIHRRKSNAGNIHSLHIFGFFH